MILEIHREVVGRLPVAKWEAITRQAILEFGPAAYRELSVAVVGRVSIQRLNRQYRKKNKPTDVLSFDHGEIIICYPVARRQAKEHKISVAKELALLFAHGLLHTLGFDHLKPKDKNKMAAAELFLLGYSGLIDLNIQR